MGSSLLARIGSRAPNSTQVLGVVTLVIAGAVLLVLAGLTVTAGVTGLAIFGPLILITIPIWVPAAAVAFLGVTGMLSAAGFAVAAVAGAAWLYRYLTGGQPVGSGRVDYARSRIADTASTVKDYARECGGYLQSRNKDAAPGA